MSNKICKINLLQIRKDLDIQETPTKIRVKMKRGTDK
jgi:hypothetical protein